jgi:hypothetical protein
MIDSDEPKLRRMEAAVKTEFRASLDAREACARLAESLAERQNARWRRAWPTVSRVHAVALAVIELLARLALAFLRLWSRVYTPPSLAAPHGPLKAVAPGFFSRLSRRGFSPSTPQHTISKARFLLP